MNIEKYIVVTGFSLFFFFRIHVIQIFQGFLVKGEHTGFPRYIPTLSGDLVASWQIFSGVWCGLCGVARYQEPRGKRGFYKFSEIQIECLRLYVYTGGGGLVSPAKPPETRV